jgi:GNAT superfamily N-acetyltransferase
MISVRQAEMASADDDFLVGNLVGMAQELEGISLNERVARKRVVGIMKKPKTGRYFIAENGNRYLGSLLLVPDWDMLRHKMTWWMADVYVVPDSRGKGVFKAMFREIVTLAALEPLNTTIRLNVQRSNLEAVVAYTRMGMTDAAYRTMELAVPSASTVV